LYAFESLLSKMALSDRTSDEKCQPADLEIVEIFNIPQFWCQPKKQLKFPDF